MYSKSYRFYRFYKFYRLPYLIIFQQARSQTQLLCFQSTWSNHKKLNICIFNNNLCVMFLVQKMYVFHFMLNIPFLKKNMAFFMDGVQLSQGYRATMRKQFTFWHLLTRSLWYSTDRPPNDKTLSWPCGQPVVLNPGPRNWEPSALTTTPFFSLWVKSYYSFFKKSMMVLLSGFPLLPIANDQRQKCWELRENKIFLSFYNLVTILAKQFNIFC